MLSTSQISVASGNLLKPVVYDSNTTLIVLGLKIFLQALSLESESIHDFHNFCCHGNERFSGFSRVRHMAKATRIVVGNLE